MKAAEALSLTRQAESTGAGHKRMLLDLWYEAIRKAAKDAKRSVRECDLDTLRCMISAGAWQQARAHLIDDGFKVEYVRVDLIESTYEVSW